MPADDKPDRGNPERLRAAIDHGWTADKVSVSDPAAAPLGTDDEAGDHPATAGDVELALRQETAPRIASEGAARRPDLFGRRSAPLLLAMVIVGLVLIGATGVVILR
jgi:hypothetical protein